MDASAAPAAPAAAPYPTPGPGFSTADINRLATETNTLSAGSIIVSLPKFYPSGVIIPDADIWEAIEDVCFDYATDPDQMLRFDGFFQSNRKTSLRATDLAEGAHRGITALHITLREPLVHGTSAAVEGPTQYWTKRLAEPARTEPTSMAAKLKATKVPATAISDQAAHRALRLTQLASASNGAFTLSRAPNDMYIQAGPSGHGDTAVIFPVGVIFNLHQAWVHSVNYLLATTRRLILRAVAQSPVLAAAPASLEDGLLLRFVYVQSSCAGVRIDTCGLSEGYAKALHLVLSETWAPGLQIPVACPVSIKLGRSSVTFPPPKPA